MHSERANEERSQPKSKGQGSEAAKCCAGDPEIAGPWNESMKGMLKACPCGGWLKRHRLAVYTVMAGVGLGTLILQVGWVLGVIAFFRTF